MKIDKINLNGEKSSIEVLDKIFASKINKQLVSNVLYKTNSNYKGRKAKTKQKNEIIGSTAKIYSQKGTGNARHASRKAPIFVGGGVAHGPKGEDNYKIRKLNKSEKKLSIASLITEKNKLKNLMIFNDFDKEIKKTKEMNNILKKFEANNALLILDKLSRNNIYKSAKNIPNIKVTDINHFSAFDIVKYKKLIFTITSVKELEKRYINE
jgi:50S ribosomal protein L4, bacterial/organelle